MSVISWLPLLRPTRLRAYASTTPLPRPPPGSLPVWVGSPLTGRVSHPLDDKQSFMMSSHHHSPLTSLAWSHRATTPLITDKLRSYSVACRAVMPSVLHCTDQYANNRAEVSHQPTRQRERQMRRFKSAAQLQRFASVHGIVQNLFRVGRHLLRSAHHRLLRTRAFVEWDVVTYAC